MGRIKHPEYATPPAFIHPTDIVRGFVDPDEAARRWNAHDALVALARDVAKPGMGYAPTMGQARRWVREAVRLLAKMDGPK